MRVTVRRFSGPATLPCERVELRTLPRRVCCLYHDGAVADHDFASFAPEATRLSRGLSVGGAIAGVTIDTESPDRWHGCCNACPIEPDGRVLEQAVVSIERSALAVGTVIELRKRKPIYRRLR